MRRGRLARGPAAPVPVQARERRLDSRASSGRVGGPAGEGGFLALRLGRQHGGMTFGNGLLQQDAVIDIEEAHGVERVRGDGVFAPLDLAGRRPRRSRCPARVRA